MPIKKDGADKRWVEMEALLPGTPEQVWEAMATGPGNAAWFLRAEIEPRVGGALVFHFGDGVTSKGEVTEWQPPHRFGYVERKWAEGAPPVVTEITLVARSGGKCVMRMVHSLFTSSDDWDDQIEGLEGGWPHFFAVLRLYLARFVGQPAASYLAVTSSRDDALSAWLRIGEVLGFAGASVGERRTSPAGPERWMYVVEQAFQDAKQRYVILRIEGASPGLALVGTYDKGGATNVSLARYHYGNSASELSAEHEPRWRKWLTETFGSGEDVAPR